MTSKNYSLRPINIILTAAGCPGASTIIRYLQKIKERKIKIIGVDSNLESIGRFLADAFEVVPNADDPLYIDTLVNICIKYNIDCILVSSSYEVEHIAANVDYFKKNNVKALVSSLDSLKIANNKHLLYETFKDDPDVNVPKFILVNNLDDFIKGCELLGYPDKKLCFKPPISKGSRGFRYIDSEVNRADLLLNYKPDTPRISLNEVIEIFKNEKIFPELLLMETVQGEEIDSMILALEGDPLLITHKTREAERGGVITLGGHAERELITGQIRAILRKIKLSYNVGIQFKGGYLMEINPRLSTFLYNNEWNEPYTAIKLALGEISKEDVKSLQSRVPLNLRMIRYFDQYFYETDN